MKRRGKMARERQESREKGRGGERATEREKKEKKGDDGRKKSG